MKKLFVITCLLVYTLSSCSKNCTQSNIWIYYSPSDSIAESIIIVKKYKRGSNFSQLIDSAIYSDSIKFASTLYHTSDTLYYENCYLLPDYDWLLKFPLIGRQHTVSNIGFGNLTGSSGSRDYQCYTSVSYYYDGRDTSLPAPPPANSFTSSWGTVDIPIVP